MAVDPARVEMIFNEAVEISVPGERADFLDRACGLADFENAFGKMHARVGDTRMKHGRVLAKLKRPAEAEAELLEAERVLAMVQGAPPGRHQQCVAALVGLYTEWEKSDPGNGHAASARRWQAKLPATRPTSAPSSQQSSATQP